ncbi:MAG: hypothetical protein QOE96_602 [Blastocatellia bacterium]|nr:hypothetical protein [Blastocatellia bacterium]
MSGPTDITPMTRLHTLLALLVTLSCVNISLASTRVGFQSVSQIASRATFVGQNRTFSSERDSLIEEFSFLIKDFKMDHQGDLNNLNLTVSYRYGNSPGTDYPDFLLIAKDIQMLLAHYPNKTDYWEIVNKKLTSMVLRKYATIVSVRIRIDVSPSSADPYARSSITTRSRSNVRGPSRIKKNKQ